jgi:hypothetical protein
LGLYCNRSPSAASKNQRSANKRYDSAELLHALMVLCQIRTNLSVAGIGGMQEFRPFSFLFIIYLIRSFFWREQLKWYRVDSESWDAILVEQF